MTELLITNCAPDGGGVYIIDTASGDARQVHDVMTRGATWGPGGIYFVENDGRIHVMDPEDQSPRVATETGERGCHDLRWIDGFFYLVACRGNRVVRYDRDWNRVDQLQIVDHDDDVCHANCLIDSRWGLLLTIFTLSPGIREEKNRSDPWRFGGKVLRLDWPNAWEEFFEPLAQPHSLVERPEGLLCCESLTSELSLIETGAGERRRRVLLKAHGFLRGLLFTGGVAYVGVSVLRRNVPIEHGLNRLGRMPCGLLELDPAAWRVRRRIPTPGAAVYEILDMSQPFLRL